MSETAITIKVEMQTETSKEFTDIPIVYENLNDKYVVTATENTITKVNVVVKGVDALLNKLSKENITAYIDLTDYEPGVYEVPILVKGTDNKLTYTSRTTKVEIKIIDHK